MDNAEMIAQVCRRIVADGRTPDNDPLHAALSAALLPLGPTAADVLGLIMGLVLTVAQTAKVAPEDVLVGLLVSRGGVHAELFRLRREPS